jgi:hypothetical protein
MSTGQPQVKGIQNLRRVAAKALDDDKYRQQLIDDPAGVLTQEGVTVPTGVQVVVHQNTENQVHLVLPAELKDEHQLDADETHVTTISAAIHF